MAIDFLPDALLNSGLESDLVLTTGSGSSNIKGIFHDRYATAQMLGLPVENATVSCDCASDDLSGAAQGNTITINSVTYYIENMMPDDTGMTLVILSKDPIRT